MVVPAGKTVSASFDVSAEYDVSETGTYTVTVDTYIEYVEINVKGNGKPPIPKRAGHLSSLLVMFNVTENPSRKTLGRHVPLRKMVWENAVRLVSAPRDPSIIGGSASQRAAIKEAHRAAYHYIKAATIDLIRSPERVKTWFGKLSQRVVNNVLELMKHSLVNDQITSFF